MRKLTGAISKSKTSVIFINQIREKIGVMFGSPETTPGGRALKFYCLLPDRRPPDRPAQGGRGGDRPAGAGQGGQEQGGPAVPRGRVRHDARPTASATRATSSTWPWPQKIVTRTGAWFRYGEEQLGQGREKVRQYLKENPAFCEELKEQVLAAMGLGPVAE